MRVLNISAANEDTGAGMAALLTHEALIKGGINSILLTIDGKVSTNKYSIQDNWGFNKVIRKIYGKLDNIFLNLYPKRKKRVLFTSGIVGLSINKFIEEYKPDVIHIHWLGHGMLNYKHLNNLNIPVVWTIRDMWAFTGGCHYSFECSNYLNGCGFCPELNSNNKNDLSKILNKLKIDTFKNDKIKFVAISDWIKDAAIKSNILFNKNIPVIFSGVNTNNFFSINKTKARESFSLKNEAKVILVGATDIREKYKGFDILISLLNMLPDEFIIVTFGDTSFEDGEIKQNHIHLGRITGEKLRSAYNVADLFLCPSIIEAMGKTVVESLLCGTPVLAFRNTGPSSLIRHKIDGFLAEHSNINEMLLGINFLLANKLDKNEIENSARKRFDINLIALQYRELYEKICLDRTNSK
jgi:glycosyltransferase involved in cell wall biosynthesis